MARPAAAKLARVACRGLQSTRAAGAVLPSLSAAPVLFHPAPLTAAAPAPGRRFLTSTADCKGITPDDKPRDPKDVVTPKVAQTPANMTDKEYHAVADEYLDKLLTRLEEIQDAREDVDVEFSAGVMTVNLGDEVGTYVINKQPPNKQIWLSSPRTGPKRYDYVVLGESQHEKQDTAVGDWVYIRDGSTLSDLLLEEIGVDLSMPVDHGGS
ncbi:Frataxin [Trichocladium antarcticum]|uniref:ferroxidase n=1 Tax=Trichocladium antarcticum TaxID=1450529 RepID=A0AAN6ZFM8_9PEZI|nr:Frataxin [Trichocladium antarcticum]